MRQARREALRTLGVLGTGLVTVASARATSVLRGERIALPDPQQRGGMTLAAALASRRSLRAYLPRELTANELAQLLWAAQGITDRRNARRSAPSAGALYPLQALAVLPGGIYRYHPTEHVLERVRSDDARADLARAAFSQEAVARAPCVLALGSVDARTTRKYGERGVRYVHMEAGHAAQNVLLAARALGLGAVPVGAFHDDQVGDVLRLPAGERPLYLLPVGA